MNFITLYNVKKYNDYTYINASAPTVAENETAGYLNNETWLDSTTGYSYKLIDQVAGTWTRIEKAQDTKILVTGDNTLFRTITWLQNPFVIPRNGLYTDSDKNYELTLPDEFTREEADLLYFNECIYSECTFSATLKNITLGSTIWGSINSFKIGDIILVSGSLRNNGYYTITSTTSTKIAVAETLLDSTAKCFIYLVSFPDGFLDVIARMINFDIFIRKTTDISSERIGTYSYTLKSTAGGTAYPEDIANDLAAYEGISLGGTSVYVP